MSSRSVTRSARNVPSERGDIEQENVCDVASEDTTLDGSTNSDSLVRVDTLTRLAADNALTRV